MNQIHAAQVSKIASFIWTIADDCLRDVYSRGKYRDVILPMTVIRRIDAVLEPTKEKVIEQKKRLDAAKIQAQSDALCLASGQAFYNSSPFCLKDLTSRAKPQQLKADFIAYLDGYSPNIQEILDKFKFRNQIDTMIEAGILGAVIEKFVSSEINLSMNDVLDKEGKVKIHGLDNHMMGTLFEELLRKFNEENNEEAGEHFTPRDVVELMADLVFMPIADKIEDGTYLLYDDACGTGGMLTVGEQRLNELAIKYHKKFSVHLFGQETVPETYAICKSDMLLKGKGEQAEHIFYGSTLSNDGFAGHEFDFMISNPPYGKSWKIDAERMGGKKKDISDPRFVVLHKNEELSMIPRVSDGQMLFLANNVSKMKSKTKLGSRIAEVHNGSSLFTGDAGSGESNFRRYIFESDLVEAIIALPENIFYNTGIATYIWVLSNKKSESRRGKVQLIDAASFKTPLRKNLGMKNCEVSFEQKNEIVKLLTDFKENEFSKIFRNEEFLYWSITVERPKVDEAGNTVKDKKGNPKADADLRDVEQVPYLYEGGIEAFMKNEVLPYSPDAWVDYKKTQIGCELSFTKYFYKPVELRSLDEIVADIRALEKESDGLLDEILRD